MSKHDEQIPRKIPLTSIIAAVKKLQKIRTTDSGTIDEDVTTDRVEIQLCVPTMFSLSFFFFVFDKRRVCESWHRYSRSYRRQVPTKRSETHEICISSRNGAQKDRFVGRAGARARLISAIL